MALRRSLVTIIVSVFGILFLSAGNLMAGAFMLEAQSARGMANAWAGGAAAVEDASTIYSNPAGMTRLPGTQIDATGFIVKPYVKFDNKGSTTSPLVGGQPLTGGSDGDAGTWAFFPNLYYAQQITDKLHAGIGFNVPFGLETEYDRHWVGRYYGVKSKIETYNINPNIAYRLVPWLSLGAGFSAQYIDVKYTNAVDFGTIGALGGLPTAPQSLDGFAKLTADDWGWTWNGGLLIEPTANLRFGASYTSDIDYTLKGDAKISAPAGLGQAIAEDAGLVDTNAKADITLPGRAEFGAYWRLHPKFALMGDILWTHWSELNELKIKLDTGTNIVTTLDWNDTWRYSLGASYYLNENWTIRAGVAYDQTPVSSSKHREPRVPDNNRFWTTVGLGYRFSKSIALDLAYAHIFVEDGKINKDGLDNDITRGALHGNYDNYGNQVGLQLSMTF
jgi:long-chain fatty acid transport protein